MTDTNSILYKIGQAVKIAGQSGGGGGPPATDDYSEPTFTSGVLTSLTTWTSNGGTKVSSKTFSYTSGNLTSVVEKDGSDTTTLTKTIAYDAEGNLASVTKDYA